MPTPRSVALMATDGWSSAAAAASVDAPLGDDGRWAMGTGLSLGSACPCRHCQETWRTEMSDVRRESDNQSERLGACGGGGYPTT